MSTPSSKHAPPALPHPSSPEATPTNVAPSLPRTNVMRQDGAPSWELTLLVGHEPDLLLMNSDVFLPLFHDEWRPQEGPEHLLRQSSPSMIRVSHQRLTASEGEAIKDQIQKDMARITALNLVLDLLGMQVDHLVETMRAAGQLVAVLARSLTVLKIWIRTSCRLDLNKENEMRVFCDLEHPAVTNFFRVFELKQKDKGPLLSNLQHLWIEIREQYDRQLVDQEHELADLDLKLWKALPKQYLLDQTCLLEFVFHSTSRYIKFPPQVNTTNPHNFFFKLNDVSSPSKLLVEYRQQDLAQWAPYMAKMSLVPPYKLHELEPLWSQFSALTHLWIALPGKADEDLTFVQLIRSLGTSERGGKHLKMLQVEIWDSIINLTQARDYLQQKRLPPLPSIEVLTIVKHHFTHHDQVKLHESILTKLFPNVRIFSLWVKDDQCGECGEKTRNCVYDYAVLELAFWQYIQAWIVVLTNQFENLRLISTMPSEEVIQRKWFDFSVFHRETPLMDDDHQPEQHPEASPSAHTVTLMFGNSPELLLEDSHLFVLWHDRWRPDEGPEAAVLGVDKNLYKRRLTSEGCDAILGQLRGNSPTVLNLVIDLYGMTKEEVIVAMEVAKDLLSALARTLRVLKIWLRSSIRLRQGPKPVESTDLDLPAMSEFFKIFAQREDKGFLLRNVTHLWIDIHEELDHCLVAVGTTCDLKPVHWKQQALMAYLYTQTNLIEFAFNSTHRWIKFPSKSFSATKNLFNFLIFTEHSPAKLLVDYGPDGFARWANRVTMITLIPPCELCELNVLWPLFQSLVRLRITLDSDECNFIQLVHSLGSCGNGSHVSVLEVQIMTIKSKIIDPDQVQKLQLSPNETIEVLSIVKDNLTDAEEVNLHEDLFSKLFPALRFFSLMINDSMQKFKGKFICKTVIEPVRYAKSVEAWRVTYRGPIQMLNLNSLMTQKEIIEAENWFDYKVNQCNSTAQQDEEEGAQLELILLVGTEPDQLLHDSHLFVPYHSRWCPDQGQKRLTENSLHHEVLLPEHCKEILNDLGKIQGNLTKLNLVLNLFDMTKDELLLSVQQARALVGALAPSLTVLKIWIRCGIRLCKTKVDSYDLELPVLSEFFELFTLKKDKESLLGRLEYLWIDIQEKLDDQQLDPDCEMPTISKRPWKGCDSSLLTFLQEQTSLHEFAFNSTYRLLDFPSTEFRNTKHLFNFSLFTENSPAQLIVKYNCKVSLARWSSHVTMLSLVPPYKHDELALIWPLFESLVRLRITLDRDTLTFTELIDSLGRAESTGGKWHLSVLEVQIDDDKILDARQVRSLNPLPNRIEVLSIEKCSFSQTDQINLHGQEFSKLFPALRFFSLLIIDTIQYKEKFVYKNVIEPLRFCAQSFEAWRINYWGPDQMLALNSEMEIEVVEQENWLDIGSNQHIL